MVFKIPLEVSVLPLASCCTKTDIPTAPAVQLASVNLNAASITAFCQLMCVCLCVCAHEPAVCTRLNKNMSVCGKRHAESSHVKEKCCKDKRAAAV